MKSSQDTWKKESGFIWSMIGSAVGFANILSFSALCYKNGGGAFLFPYIIAHICVGIPMLYLEATVGQTTKLPLVSACGRAFGKKGKMMGWLSILTCATIGGFYMVLTGYAIAYIGFTAFGTVGASPTIFFKEIFLKDTGSIHSLGKIAPLVLTSTMAVFLITGVVLIKNIQKGIEKLCSLFLPLLGILISLLMVITLFLPGASIGLKAFLIPEFHKLLSPEIWIEAFGQVFFSLSLGLGIVTGYSRHNPSFFSVRSSMIKVALGDFIISLISGVAIFSCIGYLSLSQGQPFSHLISSDSPFEIGFIIFPTILNLFGPLWGKVLGPLFFFCIFIAGITGVFSIVEAVCGNMEYEFHHSRKKAVLVSLSFMAMIAFVFCFGNGQYLISALVPMVLRNMMLYGGVMHIFAFLFKSEKIRNEPIWFFSKKRSLSYNLLCYGIFPMLLLSLGVSIFQDVFYARGFEFMIRWGWLICAILMMTLIVQRSSKVPLPEKNF